MRRAALCGKIMAPWQHRQVVGTNSIIKRVSERESLRDGDTQCISTGIE